MIRIEQVLRLVLIVGLAGLVSAEELPPASSCELAANQLHPGGSGTGGTGLRGDEGSGTGGTGLSGHASSGIGGTGLRGDEGSGTGGTGILGTITGFGSICVNGLRIGYDDATPVLRNGEAATAKDLAVGHVVRVTAESGTPLRARRIVMESALSGPVTRVDREARRVWVMGQPVELSDDGVVAALEPGDRAEISGQRRADGVVVATRIDRSEPEELASVVGVAESVSGNTAYVADLRAKVASGAPEFESGDRVVFRGIWNPRTGTLEDASVTAASVDAPDVVRLSLQGFVRPDRAGADFRIAGTSIDASGLARADRNPGRDRMVRVEGRLDSKGRLRAARIRVERLQRSDRIDSVRSGKGEQGDRGDRGDRSSSGRGERQERSERPERSERSDRSERGDKSGSR